MAIILITSHTGSASSGQSSQAHARLELYGRRPGSPLQQAYRGCLDLYLFRRRRQLYPEQRRLERSLQLIFGSRKVALQRWRAVCSLQGCSSHPPMGSRCRDVPWFQPSALTSMARRCCRGARFLISGNTADTVWMTRNADGPLDEQYAWPNPIGPTTTVTTKGREVSVAARLVGEQGSIRNGSIDFTLKPGQPVYLVGLDTQ